MQSSYQAVPQDPEESHDRRYEPYHAQDEEYDGGYGYNYGYNKYQPRPNSLKGKVEKKYYHTKQTVIQKLGKEQDQFVVQGDAEVDSRLEAYRHIQKTCADLLRAIEFYQNRIFALSQDENEMGRFLREQGSVDKTKAGKMMIAVGKAQSYSAQQRLGLRTPLVRLYQEVETFKFRAISDTAATVNRMETARTDYRAALLWMTEISKELDPDEYRRLEKFREVQTQVKKTKKQFEKMKVDVMQKVDLLSASRCNLLSSTLATYQQALLKFWENTSRSMSQVLDQFKGYPIYQFQMLKHLNPDDFLKGEKEEKIKEIKIDEETHVDKKDDGKEAEVAQETTERTNYDDDDDDDTLISLDHSPEDEKPQTNQSTSNGRSLLESDLLGDDIKPGDGSGARSSAYMDLLGGDDLPPPNLEKEFDLLGSPYQPHLSNNGMAPPSYDQAKDLMSVEGSRSLAQPTGPTMTADDLLFGSPSRSQGGPQSDLDILNDILGGDMGPSEAADNSFTSKWREMFGDSSAAPEAGTSRIESGPTWSSEESSGFMPSDLLDSLARFDPFQKNQAPSGQQTAARPGVGLGAGPLGPSQVGPSQHGPRQPLLGPSAGKKKEKDKKADLSAWFNLFSDLDPLANPDAVGKEKEDKQHEDERAC